MVFVCFPADFWTGFRLSPARDLPTRLNFWLNAADWGGELRKSPPRGMSGVKVKAIFVCLNGYRIICGGIFMRSQLCIYENQPQRLDWRLTTPGNKDLK